MNRIWLGDLPAPSVVNDALEIAKIAKAKADGDVRASAARKILNSYPQTLNWDAEDRGMMLAVYATALEGACASTLEEISHPSTIPFGVHPPSAPEIVKSVQGMNQRVFAIEYRAKMIETCRAEIERAKAAPRPSEEERARIQERVTDFLTSVDTQRTPEGEAASRREKALIAHTPKPLTDGQKEELAAVRRKMESTA